MKKKYFFIALVAGILTLFLAGAYFFYFKNPASQKLDPFISSHNEAVALSRVFGNEDKAIEKFKETLALARNANESAIISQEIAINLFYRNIGDDRAEAFSLLKSIVKNHDFSAGRHASVLNTIAFFIRKNATETEKESAKKYLFNDEPYAGYLAENNGDVREASRKIFEEADKLYPNSFSKINIAYILAIDLLNGKTKPGISTKDTAIVIQKYVVDGNALFNDPNFGYTNYNQALMLFMKAVALRLSDRELHNISQIDMETAYKRAISAADSDANYFLSQEVGAFSRFYYALYLMNSFGNSRKSDIVSMLEKIISGDKPQYKNFHDNLAVIADYPKDNLLKITTLKLVAIFPDFRAFLTRYGWIF